MASRSDLLSVGLAALTGLGLAARTGGLWMITDAGVDLVQRLGQASD
ncbi:MULTISPECIES: hypothetical protein [unclassified Caulobacter]|jgi:hypothetical protein|nr:MULTISPECIES: hypothetical protein [unclassified Caulobacter]